MMINDKNSGTKKPQHVRFNLILHLSMIKLVRSERFELPTP